MSISLCSAVRSSAGAFTLIEVLVVVAIIALLVSVLMPAMKSAKESAKATVCLSNLKQQGSGFMGYAKDNKSYLPYGGRFKYSLIDGGRDNLHWMDNPPGERWNRQGNGLLYPKYTGNTLELFYCASNKGADAEDPTTGKKQFMYLYSKPNAGDYGNTYKMPIGGYCYAIPLARGKCPREGVKYFYPEDSMEEVQPDPNDGKKSSYRPYSPAQFSAYHAYLWDPVIQSNNSMNRWLAPLSAPRTTKNPYGPRGAYPIQVLLTDSYVGGYEGYHVNGWNVLFSDFHAKRVGDPSKKIDNLPSSSYTYPGWPPRAISSPIGQGACSSDNTAATWVVWDYFGRNP